MRPCVTSRKLRSQRVERRLYDSAVFEHSDLVRGEAMKIPWAFNGAGKWEYKVLYFGGIPHPLTVK